MPSLGNAKKQSTVDELREMLGLESDETLHVIVVGVHMSDINPPPKQC